MFICMQVCLYVYMWVCLFVCMYVCIYVCIYLYMYVCMKIFIRIILYFCNYVYCFIMGIVRCARCRVVSRKNAISVLFLFLLLRFFCFEKRVIVSGFYWEGKRVEEGRGCEGDRVVSSSRGTSESSNPGRWGLGGYNGIWEEGGGYTVGGIFSVRFRYFWLTLHYPCS